MFDPEELQEIVEKNVREGTEERGETNTKVLAISLAASLVFLVVVLIVSVSFSTVGALSVGGVGGFYVEADSLEANNIVLHPHPTQSAACKANFTDPNAEVVSENEVALPAVRADARQLRIPATDKLKMTKDIRLPELANLDVVRINLERGEVLTNPNYPPTADAGPVSVGDNPRSLLHRAEFAGILVETANNDGYADLTFRRTRNITDGESNTATVIAQGEYDYSRQGISQYPFTSGINSDRYVDDVSINGLSNTGTGDDGGYVDFTSRSTDNVSRGNSPTLSVDATTSGAVYGDANATRYATTTGSPGSGYFEQIDRVNISGIDNSVDNPTDGDGYSNFTNIHSNNLTKGSFPELLVDFERAAYGDASIWASTSAGDPHPCDGSFAGCDDGNHIWIEQVTFGDSYDNTSDDGYLDATDIDGTVGNGRRPVMGAANLSEGAGSTLTINFWSGDQGDCEDECEPYRMAAWIDWDNNQSYEADEKIDFDNTSDLTSGTCDDGTQNAAPDDDDTQDYPLRCAQEVTPNSDAIREGTVGMRVILAYCEEPTITGGTATQDTSCGGDDSNWAGEMQDYTVAVEDPQWVSAWADWDQDYRLEGDEQTVLAENVRTINAGSNNVVATELVEVPDEAKAGKTLLRVVRSDDIPPVTAGEFEGETEDYTLHVNEERMNSGVNAFVDWNQNGEFDRNELENEDVPTSSEPFGWNINGPVAAVSDQISNSPIYAVRIGTNTTANEFVSTQSFDTSNAGGVYLNFWIAKGSDDYVNKPESGENLIVEYRDSSGNWRFLDEFKSDSYRQAESVEKEYLLTRPNALHTDFDVRFRGNGAGTDGGQYDNWYVDDVKIDTSIEAQRVGSSTLVNGEFSVSNGLDVPVDAEPGSTLLRISHKQEGYPQGLTYPSPTEDELDHEGEVEDYTIHVEPDESYVRAWVDWNDDGDFQDTNEGPYDFGSPVTFPDNNGKFTVSDTINAPSTVGTGPRLMRITHKQEPPADQPPIVAEGDGGWKGETEDYTVIVGPEGDISDDGNLTIGDASFTLTSLTAESLTLDRALIDEDYSDNTRYNPVFGRSGEIQVGGDEATLLNIRALVHSVQFRVFRIPKLNITMEYDPPNPQNKTDDVCSELPY